MSLLELLIVLALVGIFSAGMSAVYYNIQKDYQTASVRMIQETDAIDLMFTLKRYISGAVDLNQVNPGTVGSLALAPNNGQIAAFDLSNGWTPSAVSTPRALALFFREDLKTRHPSSPASALPTDAGRYIPTGIFIVPPTVNRFGVVGFNLGDSTMSSLSGNRIELRFTNIVDFKIENIVTYDVPAGSPTPAKRVASFVVKFTKRIYGAGDGKTRTWCPPAHMNLAACATQSPYRDITKSIEIFVRNNNLGDSNTRRVADGANSYPPGVKRIFDGVYFLRPLVQIGSDRR